MKFRVWAPERPSDLPGYSPDMSHNGGQGRIVLPPTYYTATTLQSNHRASPPVGPLSIDRSEPWDRLRSTAIECHNNLGNQALILSKAIEREMYMRNYSPSLRLLRFYPGLNETLSTPELEKKIDERLKSIEISLDKAYLYGFPCLSILDIKLEDRATYLKDIQSRFNEIHEVWFKLTILQLRQEKYDKERLTGIVDVISYGSPLTMEQDNIDEMAERIDWCLRELASCTCIFFL